MAARGLHFAVLAILAANAASPVTSATVTCFNKIPVQNQSCTLDLNPGDEGEFECANPDPPTFPKVMLEWSGKEMKPEDIFGKDTVIVQKDGKYKIIIPKSANTAAAGITCSQTPRAPTKRTAGVPTRAEAEKLLIHSLVIRVNNGPSYSRDLTAQGSGAADATRGSLLMATVVGAAAFALAI